MKSIPKERTWIILVLTATFFALLMTEVARETPRNGMRRTEPIRQNMARLRTILMTLEQQLDTLHELNESEQVVVMRSAVDLLKDYLLPHLAAEEASLYPAVDRQLHGSRLFPTEAMKLEHAIMRRWIQEMEAQADAAMPDHNVFARRGERLLGLVEAHFEVDEAVLFPVLDQAVPLAAEKARGKRGATDAR